MIFFKKMTQLPLVIFCTMVPLAWNVTLSAMDKCPPPLSSLLQCEPTQLKELLDNFVREYSAYFKKSADIMKDYTWQADRILVCGFKNFVHQVNAEVNGLLQAHYSNSSLLIMRKFPQFSTALSELLEKYNCDQWNPLIASSDDEKTMSLDEMNEQRTALINFFTAAQAKLIEVADVIYAQQVNQTS